MEKGRTGSAVCDSPIGFIGIQCTDVGVEAIEFLQMQDERKSTGKFEIIIRQKPDEKLTGTENTDADEMISRTLRELKEYFAGKRKNFTIPCVMQGTDFQKKVWRVLSEIPYGEVRTYKEIAVQTGNPKACRAVGMANHNNPIPIIIPCHRVVGSNGKLTGYAGGLEIKEKLLELERENR